MTTHYTAKYTKVQSGYMGQLLEWPEVVTEGKDLEDCRKSLKDALHEMLLAHQQSGRELPAGADPFEPVAVDTGDVR